MKQDMDHIRIVGSEEPAKNRIVTPLLWLAAGIVVLVFGAVWLFV